MSSMIVAFSIMSLGIGESVGELVAETSGRAASPNETKCHVHQHRRRVG